MPTPAITAHPTVKSLCSESLALRHPANATPSYRPVNRIRNREDARSEVRRQNCGCYDLNPAEIDLLWQTAVNGIAVLAYKCYRPNMRTLTVKVPDGLLGWLEEEAKGSCKNKCGPRGFIRRAWSVRAWSVAARSRSPRSTLKRFTLSGCSRAIMLGLRLRSGSCFCTSSKRAQRPKSALVREILQQHQQRQHQSALDLAADLCGCVQSGLRGLSRNKKHLKGFGR